MIEFVDYGICDVSLGYGVERGGGEDGVGRRE